MIQRGKIRLYLWDKTGQENQNVSMRRNGISSNRERQNEVGENGGDRQVGLSGCLFYCPPDRAK